MNINTYFLCATPRTGSTLLCALLKSSMVAGNPESYFRDGDYKKWSKKWGLADNCSFKDYLEAYMSCSRTPNGIFATRLMWGQIEPLADKIRSVSPYKEKGNIDILVSTFGVSKFIYLERMNYVAQAVSRLKAEQSDVWHIMNNANSEQSPISYKYDFDKLTKYRNEAAGHNQSWLDWFFRNNIQPHKVDYENLSQDPVTETKKVLEFLGLEALPEAELFAPNKRMADSISESWIERYRFEAKI